MCCFTLIALVASESKLGWVCSCLSGWHNPVLSMWADCVRNLKIFAPFASIITVLQICPQEVIPNALKAS